jgi:hypothetical protein
MTLNTAATLELLWMELSLPVVFQESIDPRKESMFAWAGLREQLGHILRFGRRLTG